MVMVGWVIVLDNCQWVLLIWIVVGQGPTVLAVGAGVCVWGRGRGCHLDICLSPISFLWETAGYRLKYCLREMLNPKHIWTFVSPQSLFFHPFFGRQLNID